MIYSTNFHRIWNKFVNVQLWKVRWFHVKFVKFHDFWDSVMKTVHRYNIIFPCTKQGNKLNHTFVSHNFMLSNITRNAFSQWRESYSNSFARFGCGKFESWSKNVFVQNKFWTCRDIFLLHDETFFYTIKKLLQDEKVFLHDEFLYKIKNIFS